MDSSASSGMHRPAKPFFNKYKVALIIGCALAVVAIIIVVYFITTLTVTSYNGVAAPGDYWRIDHSPEKHTMVVQNMTSGGEEVTLEYVKNENDSYDFVDANGSPRTDYIRFIEIPGYLLLLETTRAGPNGDQHSIVIGMKQETLRVTMADNPHLYYQFEKRRGGGNAGFVTFLKGRNASDEEAQWAPEAVPGDPDNVMGRVQPGGIDSFGYNTGTGNSGVHTYLEEGNGPMPIDFSVPIAEPNDHMIMREINDGEERINTIFGTESGQFVVDTPESSILCFDATRCVTDLGALVGTWTVLAEGKEDTHMEYSNGNDQEVGGTDVTGLKTIVLAGNGTDGYTAAFDGRPAMPVQPFTAEYAGHLDFTGMTPTPLLSGLFAATSGTRGTAGREELVFSVLQSSIVFRWYRHGAIPSGSSSPYDAHYSYSFGAGVQDV